MDDKWWHSEAGSEPESWWRVIDDKCYDIVRTTYGGYNVLREGVCIAYRVDTWTEASLIANQDALGGDVIAKLRHWDAKGDYQLDRIINGVVYSVQLEGPHNYWGVYRAGQGIARVPSLEEALDVAQTDADGTLKPDRFGELWAELGQLRRTAREMEQQAKDLAERLSKNQARRAELEKRMRQIIAQAGAD